MIWKVSVEVSTTVELSVSLGGDESYIIKPATCVQRRGAERGIPLTPSSLCFLFGIWLFECRGLASISQLFDSQGRK